MTSVDIVNKAARRVNIIPVQDSLDDAEVDDALTVLNGMLSMLSMEPLLAANGLVFPLTATDASTGMDDQVEFAVIDMLAVRLASTHGLALPQQTAIDAARAERNLKRWNVRPIYIDSDLPQTRDTSWS